jgi:hypothetical protein
MRTFARRIDRLRAGEANQVGAAAEAFLADGLAGVGSVDAELRVPRSTFFRWREQGIGPRVMKLPNGTVRIRRAALDEWLRGLEDDQKEHAA